MSISYEILTTEAHYQWPSLAISPHTDKVLSSLPARDQKAEDVAGDGDCPPADTELVLSVQETAAMAEPRPAGQQGAGLP